VVVRNEFHPVDTAIGLMKVTTFDHTQRGAFVEYNAVFRSIEWNAKPKPVSIIYGQGPAQNLLAYFAQDMVVQVHRFPEQLFVLVRDRKSPLFLSRLV
jgi:hypothetical protein